MAFFKRVTIVGIALMGGLLGMAIRRATPGREKAAGQSGGQPTRLLTLGTQCDILGL